MTRSSNQGPVYGQTVLITGGTGGIGYQTARALVRRGANVIITGREAEAGERAAATIQRELGGAREAVTFLQADHATVAGNRELANQVQAAFPQLNVLINNVGGLYQRRWQTADGYEATLAMNFVGPFALTGELLPLLQANAPAQCINVVSRGSPPCVIRPHPYSSPTAPQDGAPGVMSWQERQRLWQRWVVSHACTGSGRPGGPPTRSYSRCWPATSCYPTPGPRPPMRSQSRRPHTWSGHGWCRWAGDGPAGTPTAGSTAAVPGQRPQRRPDSPRAPKAAGW